MKFRMRYHILITSADTPAVNKSAGRCGRNVCIYRAVFNFAFTIPGQSAGINVCR